MLLQYSVDFVRLGIYMAPTGGFIRLPSLDRVYII